MSIIGSIISDTLSKMLTSIGKTMGLKFIDTIRSRPEKPAELKVYEKSTKQFAISQLLDVEGTFDQILEVIISKGSDLEQAKTLDRIRSRISSIRYQMESSSQLIFPESNVKVSKVIETLAYYNLILVYYCLAINKLLIEIRDGAEDGSVVNITENLNVVRKQLSSLEQILTLRPTSTINDESVKILRKQINEVSEGLVDLFTKIIESSYSQIDLAFKEITLKRPKLFGKQKYMEALEDLIIKIIKNSPKKSMSVQEIRDILLEQIPEIKITIDEIQQAGKNLYSKKLIYGLREDKNTVFIDLKGSSVSPKCSHCKREGGLFMDYYTCPSGGYVCANCVSFFGKCKNCEQKLTPNHKIV